VTHDEAMNLSLRHQLVEVNCPEYIGHGLSARVIGVRGDGEIGNPVLIIQQPIGVGQVFDILSSNVKIIWEEHQLCPVSEEPCVLAVTCRKLGTHCLLKH